MNIKPLFGYTPDGVCWKIYSFYCNKIDLQLSIKGEKKKRKKERKIRERVCVPDCAPLRLVLNSLLGNETRSHVANLAP